MQRKPYRSKDEIDMAIMETMNKSTDSVAQTRIMYESYLNWLQIVERIDVLVQLGLVAIDPNDANAYYLTARGQATIEAWKIYLSTKTGLAIES